MKTCKVQIVVAVLFALWMPACTGKIHRAVEKGDIAKVKELLARKAERINSKDKNYYTPLHWAAQKGHSELAKLLISKGAKINVRDEYGFTPLHVAAWEGHIEVVKLLIANGADINAREDIAGSSPVSHAVTMGRVGIVKMLIANGVKVNEAGKLGVSPLHDAAFCMILTIHDISGKTQKKLENRRSITRREATDACEEVAAFLLAKGADLNARTKWGWTPLDNAAFTGHTHMVSFLISSGADPNTKSKWGRTSLHVAAVTGHEEIATLLISKGADPNAKDNKGRTPLHIAASLGHRAFVEVLLKNGAEVNTGNNRGWTPLHYAADKYKRQRSTAQLKIAELLIARHSLINAKTKDGETPLKLAKESGFRRMVRLLRKHGGVE